MRTSVYARKVAGSANRARGASSPSHATVRKSAGTSSAVSLSQYWKACTKVMLRIPPAATAPVSTSATTRPPIQSGAPVSISRVRPAPWSWGSR